MRSRLMKKILGTAALTIAALGLASAAAAEKGKSAVPRIGEPAVIDFAGGGGIRDYYAPNDHQIYLRDRANHWYLATLSGPCRGVRINPQVAFETDPTGRFDTFSAVRTRYHRCHVTSLVRAEGPRAK